MRQPVSLSGDVAADDLSFVSRVRAPLRARAPAKINLTLHIEGRREDGYHNLRSMVAFASVADHVVLTAGEAFSLAVSGMTAAAAGPLEDNLIARATRQLAERKSLLRTGAFTLEKRLPVAAGVGGGSSDAAAALRLLARLNELRMDDPDMQAAAAAVGADVPVCLEPRARMMSGIGDILGPTTRLPPLFAVLINPRVAVETRLVFARMGLKPGETATGGAHPDIEPDLSFDELIARLRKGRNDMEDAASVIAPVIGSVIAVLSAARGCRLARMSGSGATCFGLFSSRIEARDAARAIARTRPQWWVVPTLLR